MPSDQLWEFASNVPRAESLIYRPRMVAPLPGWRGHYLPLLTKQPRIFPQGSIRWPNGGIDILPVRAIPEADIPEVLWHFNLWAPRVARETKAAAHEAAWNLNYESHPWPYPGRKSYLYEDHMELVQPFEECDLDDYRLPIRL